MTLSTPENSSAPDKSAWLWLIIILLVGFAVRGSHLFYPPLDSDYATVGLMGMHIMNGDWFPIFWGQAYGGTLEPTLAAILFSIFGVSNWALSLAPILFSLWHLVMIYLLGKEIHNRNTGLVAAFLAALGPYYLILWSVVASGLHAALLPLGAWLMLVTVRMQKCDPKEKRYLKLAFFFGLVCGIGIWNNLLMLYFILPCGLLAWRHNPWLPLRPALLLMAAGLAVGGSPLWYYNIVTHGSSFIYLFGSSRPHDSAMQALYYFFSQSIPVLTGITEGNDHKLVLYLPLAVLGAVGAIWAACLAFPHWLGGLWQSLKSRKPENLSGILLLMLAAMVFIFSYGGASAGKSHRYLISFFVVWPLAGAYAFSLWLTRPGWQAKAAWVGLGLLVMLNLGSSIATHLLTDQPFLNSYKADRALAAEIIQIMRNEGMGQVYVHSYWQGPKWTFLAEENPIFIKPGRNRTDKHIHATLRGEKLGGVFSGTWADIYQNMFRSMGLDYKVGKKASYTLLTDIHPTRGPGTPLGPGYLAKASASGNQAMSLAVGDLCATTRWTTKAPQEPGQWLELDLGRVMPDVCNLWLFLAKKTDAAEKLQIDLSRDGDTWQTVTQPEWDAWPMFLSGGKPVFLDLTSWREVRFAPQPVRYIRLRQEGEFKKWWWSMPEIMVGVMPSEATDHDEKSAAAWIDQSLEPGIRVWCEPALKACIPEKRRIVDVEQRRPDWLREFLFPQRVIQGNAQPAIAVRTTWLPLARQAMERSGWEVKVESRHGYSLLRGARASSNELHFKSVEHSLKQGRIVAMLPGNLNLKAVMLHGSSLQALPFTDLVLEASQDGKQFEKVEILPTLPPELYWSGLTPLSARVYPLRLDLETPVVAEYIRVGRKTPGASLPQGLGISAAAD